MPNTPADPEQSMFQKRYRRRAAPGTRPGAIHIPEGALPPDIRVTCYGPTNLVDQDHCTWDQAEQLIGKHRVTWIDIVGMGNESLFEQVGSSFRIHRLALEDVVNIPQRAKVEQYQDHLFIVCQFPKFGKKHSLEQVSIFAGKDFVITWREHPDECFDTVRHRLQFTGRAMRESGPDYLVYALLDVLIDRYFPTLEKIENAIDRIDAEMERGPTRTVVKRVHVLRHDVRLLRRLIWPLREAIDNLATRHAWLIEQETSLYLRDCHDHVIRILDSLENYREACSDLRDYYATEVSNRMNEVMKVLTVISTIFIPLAFVTGLYGMNFDPNVSMWNMPETKWRYGYPAVLLLMLAILVGQLAFFRWKGWLATFTSRNHKAHNRDH